MTNDLDHPTKAPMLESVVRAKRLVLDGWIQGHVSYGDRFCFTGALGKTAFDSTTAIYMAQSLWALKKELWNDSDNDLWDYFYDIYLLLGFPHNDGNHERNPLLALTEFNDAGNTRKEDVIHAFDLIIGYLS